MLTPELGYETPSLLEGRLHLGDRPHRVSGVHLQINDPELRQGGRAMVPAEVPLGRLGAAPAVLEDLRDVILIGDAELAGHVGARRFGSQGYVLDDLEGVGRRIGAFLVALLFFGGVLAGSRLLFGGRRPGSWSHRLSERGRQTERSSEQDGEQDGEQNGPSRPASDPGGC